MTILKFNLIIAAISILLTSCYKQSIPDAMLNSGNGNKASATLSYEINGNQVTLSVSEAERQRPGARTLECVKSGGYVFSAAGNSGELVFTFFTDSLKLGNYKYTSNYGPMYVTTFNGYPQYVHSSGDNMNFNVTAYKDGRISGNFSGQLTPATVQGYPNNIYGAPGSVMIKNGSFNNVPIAY